MKVRGPQRSLTSPQQFDGVVVFLFIIFYWFAEGSTCPLAHTSRQNWWPRFRRGWPGPGSGSGADDADGDQVLVEAVKYIYTHLPGSRLRSVLYSQEHTSYKIYLLQRLIQTLTNRLILVNPLPIACLDTQMNPCCCDRIDKVQTHCYSKVMQERYGEVTKQILIGLGIAGVVVLAAAAPGVVMAAKLIPKDQRHYLQKSKKRSIQRSIDGLQRNRLITIKEKNGKIEIKLTEKGKEKFKEIQFDNIHITKPAYWDGKWRIVIFDIPDRSFRIAREILRRKLKEWEFYQLQKSVWACPWPCEDEIQMAAELYEVAPYVNIIIAERIVADSLLKKHFGL